MKYLIILSLAIVSLSACVIVQHVDPFEDPRSNSICIVENPAVRAGFLEAYKRTLLELGYEARVLEPGSAVSSCSITSTYNARWSYDWFWTSGVYLSLAEIYVYQDGEYAGRALFDTRSGEASLKRIVNADKKVAELVRELFPRAR